MGTSYKIYIWRVVKLRGRRVWPSQFPCIRLRRNLRKMSQANFETFSETGINHEGQIFWQFPTKANTFNYHPVVIHMYHSKPKTLLEIPRPLSICPLVSSEYSEYSCIHGSFPTLAKVHAILWRGPAHVRFHTFSYSNIFNFVCNLRFSYATLDLVLKHIWTF